MSFRPHPDCPLSACRALGFCTKKHFLQASVSEVPYQDFVRAVRYTTSLATFIEDITPSQMPDWLSDQYRDAKAKMIDAKGREAELDLSIFEATDEDIDAGRAKDVLEDFREFFRNNAFNAPRGNYRVFVTKKWHKHFATMASVVGVAYPEHSRWWPRVIKGQLIDPRVANDNCPPKNK